jgi:hypothetical protein
MESDGPVRLSRQIRQNVAVGRSSSGSWSMASSTTLSASGYRPSPCNRKTSGPMAPSRITTSLHDVTGSKGPLPSGRGSWTCPMDHVRSHTPDPTEALGPPGPPPSTDHPVWAIAKPTDHQRRRGWCQTLAGAPTSPMSWCCGVNNLQPWPAFREPGNRMPVTPRLVR